MLAFVLWGCAGGPGIRRYRYPVQQDRDWQAPSAYRSSTFRSAQRALNGLQKRTYSQATGPRHLLSIADLTPAELSTLVRNAAIRKQTVKADAAPKDLALGLSGKTVAMMFNKRSTRTRVSTEAAVTMLGGHPMFLGKDDIQLGVNESLYDTSVVISSMTSCMVARVGPHSDVADLAKDSSVPVINALSNDFHPLQIIADLLTIHEAFPSTNSASKSLGLNGLKVAWVGDSNNVLFDLAIGCMKMGIDIAVASPKGFGIPDAMKQIITSSASGLGSPGKLSETTVPEEAIKDADILVTDTWISMGQEEEKQKRLAAFAGYQITNELAKRGGAKEGWKFMHCLPRHPEEVADEVFYSPRSLVFPEAENRLWAAVSVCADIENLASELVGKVCDTLQVLVLVPQSLTSSEPGRMEILGCFLERLLPIGLAILQIFLASSDLAVMRQEFLEVFGTENQQLTLHKSGIAVVEHGPYRNEVLELPTGLLDDTILAGEDDGHAGKILDLSAADDQRINVEASCGKNTGKARQNTRLVLDKAVENVALGRGHGRRRGLVEDVGDCSLSGPCWRSIGHGQRSRASSQGLVGDGRS
ncbi:putative ornithine carbamoyl transferase [Paramyrothecium foliicola]|nr:putative ornithine carbamoyl transferase [Paramyrothecium foliicola]